MWYITLMYIYNIQLSPHQIRVHTPLLVYNKNLLTVHFSRSQSITWVIISNLLLQREIESLQSPEFCELEDLKLINILHGWAGSTELFPKPCFVRLLEMLDQNCVVKDWFTLAFIVDVLFFLVRLLRASRPARKYRMGSRQLLALASGRVIL